MTCFITTQLHGTDRKDEVGRRVGSGGVLGGGGGEGRGGGRQRNRKSGWHMRKIDQGNEKSTKSSTCDKRERWRVKPCLLSDMSQMMTGI